MKIITNIKELDNLIKENKEQKRIENIRFMYMTIPAVTFDDWEFSNCTFQAVTFDSVGLRRSKWVNCVFMGTRFTHNQAFDSHFEKCDFYSTTMYFTTLQNVKMIDCSFHDTNWYGLIEYAFGFNQLTFKRCWESESKNIKDILGLNSTALSTKQALEYLVPNHNNNLKKEIPERVEKLDNKKEISLGEFLEAYQKHLLWLKDEEKGQQLDLSNCRLTHKWRMIGLNLSYANLAHFEGFDGIYIKYCSFEGSNLEGVDFSDAELFDCEFKNANLSMSNWYKANLDRVIFQSCEMKESSFHSSRWDKVRVRETNLKQSDFMECWIYNTEFDYVDMESCNMRMAHVNNSQFENVNTNQMVVFDFHLEMNNTWSRTWFPVVVDPKDMATLGSSFKRYDFLSEVLTVGDINGRDRRR